MTYHDLAARLEEVRERIAAAQQRAGRAGERVTVVAVTKTHPPDAVTAAVGAGIGDAGENRVQELESKVEAVGRDAVRWHLIGHLQRNKARRALPLFDLMHSLDSLRLGEALNDAAVEAGRTVSALVQVNASGEASKSGFAPDELVDSLGRLAELPGLRLQGLMTMAPFVEEEAVLRRTFASTRRLLEEARRQLPSLGDELSMGMSNDYEVAVEEGSTLVRLGTVLFGARDT